MTAEQVVDALKQESGFATESPKEETARVLCYVPVAVKKAVHERQAKDPRPSPPSENYYLVQLIERGLIEQKEYPTLFAESMFKIDKTNKEMFVNFGITMPTSLRDELKANAKNIPQNPAPGQKPVRYSIIDLVACLLTAGAPMLKKQNV